jgi:hypothetical protein
MSNFPTKVNTLQAPAVNGDFASQNPRASLLAGQGELIAPAGGLIVGNFAFVTKGSTGESVSQSYSGGSEVGLLAREQQALITTFLAGDTLVVPQGFMVTLYVEGDFFLAFPGGATPGQSVYADETDGAPISAASAPAASSNTGIIGTTNDLHGSVTAGVLTVSANATSGVLMPGDVLTGTGLPAAGVTIASQLTGTTGSTGTYQLAAPNDGITVGAFTNGQVITSSFVDFSAQASGTLVPGVNLKSALLAANTILGAQQTGTAGGTGIYAVTRQGNIASGTITTVAGIATGYTVRSFANPGELAKISTWG